MYELILFDFDGTLADSLHHGLAQYNSLAERYGFLPVTDIEGARNMKTRAFFKAHRIPLLRLPGLYRKFVSLQSANMGKISLCSGIKNCLTRLADRYRLGVLSSNSEANIRTCLRANHVEHLFDFVMMHGNALGPRIFGKHKSIRRLLKSQKLNPRRLLYVGDEHRDIESAHKAGVDSCAVTWGMHPVHVLRAEKPRFVVDRPSELVELLEKKAAERLSGSVLASL